MVGQPLGDAEGITLTDQIKYVSLSITTDILSSDYDSSQFTSFESDDDVKILLQCTLPSLWSQNSVVVHAAVGPCVDFCNSHPYGSLAQNKGLTDYDIQAQRFTVEEVAIEAIALNGKCTIAQVAISSTLLIQTPLCKGCLDVHFEIT
ncbi:hypothetical protein Tco_0888220 [Tanacetum coccineum]